MSQTLELRVLDKTVWSDKLFSFRTTRPAGFRFDAGQFVRLGVSPADLCAYPKTLLTDGDSAPIFRAYSLVSSPYDEYLEFFSVVVEAGAFTSKLRYLRSGDRLHLDSTPYGYLTLARFQQPPPQDLWLLATGTGLAPFLSMLADLATWERYQTIVLAYSVSFSQDLAYLEKITQLVRTFQQLSDSATTFCFLPIVTREPMAAALNQRLPELLRSQALENAAGMTLNKNSSHIMLCGNPAMVEETKETLKALGLSMNRRGVGNIAVENYW